MLWKDIASKIGGAAPLLGSLLGGKAGETVGALIASALGVRNEPAAVNAALATNPEAMIKLAQIEADNKIRFQELATDQVKAEIQAGAQVITEVNKTMQAEAASEKWPTYSWRPFCGFIFGATFLGVYLVLPLAHVPVPEVPTEAWLAMGAVLGVASWHRGKMQADTAKKD